jgi:hypothetical protein
MTGIKTKKSFGTVRVDHFSPARTDAWPTGINIVLSFEEALELQIGLQSAILKLNSHDRKTKRGRDAAVNLRVLMDVASITINEDQVR